MPPSCIALAPAWAPTTLYNVNKRKWSVTGVLFLDGILLSVLSEGKKWS